MRTRANEHPLKKKDSGNISRASLIFRALQNLRDQGTWKRIEKNIRTTARKMPGYSWYFIYKSSNCFDLSSVHITSKRSFRKKKRYFQTRISKCRRFASCFPRYPNLVISCTWLFCTAEKCTKMYDARALLFFFSLNLFYQRSSCKKAG